jgi:hypothetical protein
MDHRHTGRIAIQRDKQKARKVLVLEEGGGVLIEAKAKF